jgi:hypothetical protein
MTTQKSQWTILVYIAAHNNLVAWGQDSMKRILSVGSSPDVKLAVFYDGYGAKRMVAGAPGEAPVEEALGRFDSGDPQALIDTARWAFEQCPAERYGLVLWSHGSGWQPETVYRSVAGSPPGNWSAEEIARIMQEIHGAPDRDAVQRSGEAGSMALFRTTLKKILESPNLHERAVCFDDGSGHSLDTLELERVTQSIQTIIGQPLDLLGLDACVMSTLEVAYQLRQHVNFLVASEELVPAQSWPYDTILGALRAEPKMPARDLATVVARHYFDYYKAHPPGFNGGDVTQLALDLAHIDELARAVDGLAGALLGDIRQQAAHLWEAQRKSKKRETRTPDGRRKNNKFLFHLWDLGTLAANLAEQSQDAQVQAAVQAVRTALRPGGAVIAEGHRGAWFDGIGGVSIYAVPPGMQRISPYYSEVALAQETRWGEMLEAYHQVLA